MDVAGCGDLRNRRHRGGRARYFPAREAKGGPIREPRSVLRAEIFPRAAEAERDPNDVTSGTRAITDWPTAPGAFCCSDARVAASACQEFVTRKLGELTRASLAEQDAQHQGLQRHLAPGSRPADRRPPRHRHRQGCHQEIQQPRDMVMVARDCAPRLRCQSAAGPPTTCRRAPTPSRLVPSRPDVHAVSYASPQHAS